jgi:SAM-dependent MidA family methyltransferase
VNELAVRLADHIRTAGPLPYRTFVDVALYDETAGFYAQHGAAGRRGDFITSVEVGPLFGAVLAQALDTWWHAMGKPAELRVVEAGAGRGTLARAVLAASPECGPALRYVLVERAARLREEHPDDPRVTSQADMPQDRRPGVVLANELLDNLPFDLVEWRDGRWHDVLVAVDDEGALVEQLGARTEPVPFAVPSPRDGDRVPIQHAAVRWLEHALHITPVGRVLLFDYADRSTAMAARPWQEWVRTYRAHDRGGSPLADPGRQDVTCEVAIDQLEAVAPLTTESSQAAFLRRHGIDDLVAEGRRIWAERAAVGDLAALRARSRVREAEALLDPAGLGGFRALEWVPNAGPSSRVVN